LAYLVNNYTRFWGFAKGSVVILMNIKIFFVMLLISNTVMGNGGGEPQVVLSGVLDGTNGAVLLNKELKGILNKGENLELSGKYQLIADVHFNMQDQQIFFEHEQLPLVFNQGIDRGRIMFSTQQNENIEIDLFPDLNSIKDSYHKQQGVKLFDYDELWIDYQNMEAGSLNKVDLEFVLSRERDLIQQDDVTTDYFIFDTAPLTAPLRELEELSSEQVSTATWQAKDPLYLFKRVFDLSVDSNWRYLQEGGHVVIQRRFDRQLAIDEVLDLVFDRDTDLKGVNIRISNEDDSNIIFEWNDIPKEVIKNYNGKMLVRLFLGSFMKEKFAEREVFLQELIVFIIGDTGSVTSSRPLKSLHWLSTKTYSNNTKNNKGDTISSVREVEDKKVHHIHMVKQLERLGDMKDGEYRLKVNLQPINQQVGWGSKIESAKLFFQYDKLNNQQNKYNRLDGVYISQVKLVSLYQKKIPSISMHGSKQLNDWGVKVPDVVESKELTKWPIVGGYTPVLTSIISINSQGDRWVDLEWQVDEWLDNDSLLHLGGSSIQENQVLGVRVIPFYAGKALGNWFLDLNNSVELNGGWQSKQRVDLIKLRVFLQPLTEKQLHERQEQLLQKQSLQEVEFLLKDIVLFQVAELPFTELLNQPLPIWQNKLLQKEFKIPAASNDDFHFQTKIERENSTEYDFINLKYTTPWTFPLIEPCWLELNAIGNGVNGRREEKQQICLDKSSGSEEVSIPIWAEQIEWQVVLPKLNSGEYLNHWQGKKRDFIKLSMTGNWLQSTINDQLLNIPMFTLDGKNILPSQMKLKEYEGKLYFDSINLTASDLSRIKYLKHPWFEVKRITVEREQPFSSDEWQQINEKQAYNTLGYLFPLKLLSYLIIGLTIWWLIASGWFGKLWRGFISLFLWVWNLPITILGLFDIVVSWKGAFWWWLIVTLMLYIAGILISVTNGENYWFIFGGMAAVLAWRALVWWLQPWIEQQWSEVADKVYGGSGTHYFSGFIVVLVGVATMLMFKLGPVAEQLAVIGYYMLVVGAILEIRSLRNERSDEIGKNMIQSNHE